MPVQRRVTPSSKFGGTHLYTWVERGTMTEKHNKKNDPGQTTPVADPDLQLRRGPAFKDLTINVEFCKDNSGTSKKMRYFCTQSGVSTLTIRPPCLRTECKDHELQLTGKCAILYLKVWNVMRLITKNAFISSSGERKNLLLCEVCKSS